MKLCSTYSGRIISFLKCRCSVDDCVVCIGRSGLDLLPVAVQIHVNAPFAAVHGFAQIGDSVGGADEALDDAVAVVARAGSKLAEAGRAGL